MSDTLCNEKKKPYTFSEDGNSCIITETRTPRYWYNYLWNENHYCAQISQTGHGRSYYLSEKADMCMMNQDDARYIYLRDEKSKECWNIGEGPLNTEVENYQCVHSIGSSRIQSSYQNIASSWQLFVPEEGYQEVWTLKIKNTGERQRHLSIFSAVSFYLEGFSYPRYYEMYRCIETDYDEKLKGVYCRSAHPFAPHKRYNAFLAASEPAYAYDGNLEAFCGTTSTITRLDASASALFQRPDIVVKGKDCTNSKAALFILGGVLQHKIVLQPGEEKELTAKYVITEDNILDGEIVNVASAKGQDPKGNDIEETGSSTITPEEINAHMIVNKKTVSNPKDGKSYKYGEEIKYEITVTNDGNVTLYNVNVSDKLTGDKWTIKELTPGETSKVFKTSYKVTEKDVLAGSVVNTATATSDDILDKITPEVVPGKQEENVEAAISSVLVEKKAKEGTYKVGNTVTYEIKVINNGNVTVSGIKVIDELTGDKWTIDNLKPGEEKIFTTKYVIKKADEDRGYVKNTVKVEGLGSNGKDVSVNGESTIKVEKTEVVTKPTTGDDTQLILWATLAITCGGIIIYLTSKIRRKEEK